MARLARSELVDPLEVAGYHCINRCVRRGYLCGQDPDSGKSYEHRKAWVEQRIEFLARYFGIDVTGYAVLSNHFHVVLRSRPDVVQEWDDTEVARRWLHLCPVRKDQDGLPEEPIDAELDTIRNDPSKLAAIRVRLSDISWFMRFVAEPIARRANREDKARGHFWEGRFKAVKLCDEAALLACLAYVDLNPIRAGIADTPEASDYTSAKRRIEALATGGEQDACLAPIELNPWQIGPLANAKGQRASDKGCLPMSAADYLELLDWTGRQLARGKRGAIPGQLPPILQRIGIGQDRWVRLVQNFGRAFHRVAGASRSVMRQHPHGRPSARFWPGRSDLFDAA